jgi:hypothetical protein
LCRLIARLDLPLNIGATDAFEEYIRFAHNPRFQRVSRQIGILKLILVVEMHKIRFYLCWWWRWT